MKNKNICCDCGNEVSKSGVKRCKRCAPNHRNKRLTDSEKNESQLRRAKYKSEYFQKNKEVISLKATERRKNMNPDDVRDSSFKYLLRWKYNIDIEDYMKLLASQDGRCAICGIVPNSTTVTPKETKISDRRLYVDHDHTTKKVRGLLCMNCNSAIGHLKEDLTIMENAVSYVKLHKNEKTSINPENKKT